MVATLSSPPKKLKTNVAPPLRNDGNQQVDIEEFQNPCNHYRAFTDNPVNLVDPSGLDATTATSQPATQPSTRPASSFSGFQEAGKLTIDGHEVRFAARRVPNDPKIYFVIESDGFRCDTKTEVIQFVSRTFGNNQKAIYRNHNGDQYSSTVNPNNPVYRTDNLEPGNMYSSKVNPNSTRKAPVFRINDNATGKSQFIFFDNPNFTHEDVSEAAKYDTFFEIGGKVVYQIHWEKTKTAAGAVDYPATTVWGKAVDGLPDWAKNTIAHDFPQPATQPATQSATSPAH